MIRPDQPDEAVVPHSVARRLLLVTAVLLGAFVLGAAETRAADQKVTKSWAIAEFGTPRYDETMTHWPFANPDAPKGGEIVFSLFGSFDTFNFIIQKGDKPFNSIGWMSDSLMAVTGFSSNDEILAAYGLIAESVEIPEDRSWIVFNIHPEARFADGVPITAHDFKFTFDAYKAHGRPLIKSFYRDLESVEVLSDRRIRFNVVTRDSMKPLMKAAGMTPLARHFWAERDITKSTLDPPVASGPYQITAVDPGRSITFTRVKDYWAADLPINRGLYNFDVVRYEYFRDQSARFEAFKAGDIDIRAEESVKRWMTGYDFGAVRNGDVVRAEIPDRNPRGMSALFFNHRREAFADARVREAVNLLYDFEALQRTLLYGRYTRVTSYFPNSEYGASGPPSPAEIAVLEPYRDQLPEEVFTEVFAPPVTDGSGRNRANLRKALGLFQEAGYELRDNRLVKSETGEQLGFEIMTANPETERLTAGFVSNLRRAGIDATIRLVETAQWRNRINALEFDLYAARNNFFPPPGTELQLYFGSRGAYNDGKGNRMGYKSPVADALIGEIVTARDLETLKATSRALDRVLLWGHNVIPLYRPKEMWIAYWNKFGFPERHPKYFYGFPRSWKPVTWWYDETLAGRLERAQ